MKVKGEFTFSKNVVLILGTGHSATHSWISTSALLGGPRGGSAPAVSYRRGMLRIRVTLTQGRDELPLVARPDCLLLSAPS